MERTNFHGEMSKKPAPSITTCSQRILIVTLPLSPCRDAPLPQLPAVGKCWQGNSPGTRDRCQSAPSACPGAHQGAGEEGTGLDAVFDYDLQRISESQQQHFLPLHTALGEAGKVEGDLQQWNCAGSGAEGEGRELPGMKEHLELSALTPLCPLPKPGHSAIPSYPAAWLKDKKEKLQLETSWCNSCSVEFY